MHQLLVSISVVPAWLCGVCEPLASVRTPSGRQRKPERTSPAPRFSSAARSAPAPGSSGWDLDVTRGKLEVYFTVVPFSYLTCQTLDRQFFREVGGTLVCICAVQLPVQRSDDGGQIGAESFLPQVHGYRSQELKHTCSLWERVEGTKRHYLTGKTVSKLVMKLHMDITTCDPAVIQSSSP